MRRIKSERLPELDVVCAGQDGLHRPLGQLAGVVLQLVSQHSAALQAINQSINQIINQSINQYIITLINL